MEIPRVGGGGGMTKVVKDKYEAKLGGGANLVGPEGCAYFLEPHSHQPKIRYGEYILNNNIVPHKLCQTMSNFIKTIVGRKY